MSAAESVPLVAIDGPAASGKGTLSRMLAAGLGWNLLDSGALYRSVALLGVDRGLQTEDWQSHLPLCQLLRPQFRILGDEVQVELDGEDRTAELRSEEMSRRSAALARHIEIRDAVLQTQRDYRRPPGLVADGRDMATRVFVDFTLAVYVTAAPEERARRRLAELKARGHSANIAALTQEIRQRDQLDTERSASPLRKSDKARTLDTTSLSRQQMFQTVLAWTRDALSAPTTDHKTRPE